MKTLAYAFCALALIVSSTASWAHCSAHSKVTVTDSSITDDQKMIVDTQKPETADSAN